MNVLKEFLNRIITKNLISPASGEFEVTEKNYRKLRKVLWITMLTLALGPMFLTAFISYKNYINLLKVEEQAQVEWRLNGSVNTFTMMINNLKSFVTFIAHGEEYTELIQPGKIEKLFNRVRNQYGFIDDIGVIDHKGVQQAYAGTHNLLGHNYSEEEWFSEAHRTGTYISPVYLGHRNVPHFTIATINFDLHNNKTWFLRVTVNAKALAKIISAIKTDEFEDLFLVSENNVLQTPSTLFGEPLSEYDSITVIQDKIDENYRLGSIIYVQQPIHQTPWKLTLVVKKYFADRQWKDFSNNLFFTLGTCFIIVVITVYLLVHMIKSLIRRADAIQIKLLVEAEHTDKLASIGRLAAGVGHEINNPLAIINQKNGLAQDIIQITPDFENKSVLLDCFASVDNNINRCKAITHRLLGFARRDEADVEEVQVNDVIRDVLSFLENSIIHNKIQLDTSLETNLPPIMGNHMQLQQVFLNITNNAIDAINKDGRIEIMTHLVVDDVRVVIQDNGMGIKEDDIAHLFEPFFSTKEQGRGTGLGLSITYGLIKKMGGDISVRSNLGSGTAFTITLPMNKPRKS